MNLKEYLKHKVITSDGAMGTYFTMLHPQCDAPELYNMKEPQWIEDIHKAYISAGAKLIRTNSFACNTRTLLGQNLSRVMDRDKALEQVYQVANKACEIAKKAVKDSGKEVWILGDIGLIPENGIVSEDEVLCQYKTVADGLISAGVDGIIFETFDDFTYITPMVKYIKNQTDIPVIVSFCLNKFGYTKMGLGIGHILKTAKENECIDIIGFNCGIGSAHMADLLKQRDLGGLPVMVMPNAGYPELVSDRRLYRENISFYSENIEKMLGCGISIAGGCCGTTPDYIESVSQVVNKINKLLEANSETPTDLQVHVMGTDPLEEAVHKENNVFLNKLNSGQKPIVVELDPPYNGNGDKLTEAAFKLKQSGVDMLTFSDSPMGKMRADAITSATLIQNRTEMPVMPHMACRDKNVIATGSGIMGAHMSGIRNMLLVTGDPVQNGDRNMITSVFDFNSIRLMNYVNQLNLEYFSNDPIVFGGALNYGRANIDKEIERMEKKCQAGADFFLTQPIYGDEDIERIKYIKSKIDTHIICGIMPLVSYANALFMKNEIHGIHVPDEIVDLYSPDMTREQGENTGISIALSLIEKLKDVADGYYFMVPFNRAGMICKIVKKMKSRNEE